MSKDTHTSAVRRIRLEKHYTMSELGYLAGVSQAFISRIENGERSPAPAVQVRIARALGVSLAELFPRADRRSA